MPGWMGGFQLWMPKEGGGGGWKNREGASLESEKGELEKGDNGFGRERGDAVAGRRGDRNGGEFCCFGKKRVFLMKNKEVCP